MMALHVRLVVGVMVTLAGVVALIVGDGVLEEVVLHIRLEVGVIVTLALTLELKLKE